MYRWCSSCGERMGKIPPGRITCPGCGQETELELEPGDTILGRTQKGGKAREFRITKQLSSHVDAGMSAVYLAQRTDKPERQAALKVAKGKKLEALKREVYHLQKLRHRHIIRLAYGARFSEPDQAILTDTVAQERLCFVALEYMVGGSLKDRLRREGTLSLEEACSIVRQVSQALDYAHEQGIVHLDVKPPNILLDKDGRAVLSDFGVTRDLSVLKKRTRRNIGTLMYNAPEQIDKTKTPDRRVDVYALGLVLFEMLAGKNPIYHASSKGPSQPSSTGTSLPQRVTQTITSADYPHPRQINPSIPTSVEQVILRAMALKREERFSTAGELSGALDESVDQIIDQQRRRRRFLIFGGAAAGLALIGLGIVWILSLTSSTAEPIPAPPTIRARTTSSHITESVGSMSEAMATLPASRPATQPTVTLEATIATNPKVEVEDSADLSMPPTSTLAPTLAPAQPKMAEPKPDSSTPTDTSAPDPIEENITPVSLAEPKLVSPNPGDVTSGGIMDFTWTWLQNCQPLPEGLGFELRIWKDDPGAVPMGAMDAVVDQSRIVCDPAGGVFRYTVSNVLMAPGVSGADAGTFRWDVAVVQLDPYQVVDHSESNILLISEPGEDSGGGGSAGGWID